MTLLEIIAAGLGLVNVGLVVRRSVWNYPFGIAMVLIYTVIFYDARLYAESILQIYFVVIQFFGWWYWLHGREKSGLIIVETLTPTNRIIYGTGAALACLLIGFVFANFTDATAPWWDSAVAGLSVTAQLLLSLRKIEAWALWIIVDILAVGLFYSRELYPTAMLYSLFLIMATIGAVGWLRALRKQSPPQLLKAHQQ